MLQKNTIDFMTLLGEVATSMNAFSMVAFALALLLTGLTFATSPAVEEDGGGSPLNLKAMGVSMIPVAMVVGYVAWFSMQLVFSNSDLAGLVGLAAFLKVIIF